MLKRYENISLRKDFPEHGLQSGDVGMVIEVYENGYEVEFGDASGNTLAVLSLDAHDVAPLDKRQILHIRVLAHSH